MRKYQTFPQQIQPVEDTPAPEEKPSKFERELSEFNSWMEQAGRKENDISSG